MITHPEKLMFPDDGITKGDLAAYYEAMAPVILTHIKCRPNTMERYQLSDYAALVVQAGTATSTRGRGEVNSFNLLRLERDRVEIDTWGWDVLSGQFSVLHTETFMRSANVWALHTEGLMAAGL